MFPTLLLGLLTVRSTLKPLQSPYRPRGMKFLLEVFNIINDIHQNVNKQLLLSSLFLQDWFLSPQVYLKRPPRNHEGYRLDRILARKAEGGVKVHVLLYKNVELALTIDRFFMNCGN
jgi:hypothetical protein